MKPLFYIGILLSISVQGQKLTYKGFPSVIWPILYTVEYEKGQDQLGEFDKPLFTKKIKDLEGKVITLPGYMIPFDSGLSADTFMLSSLPLNACFFCGVGGPETAIQVHLKEKVRYMEKPVEVKGTLRLNDSDPDSLIYIMENATVLGEIDF
jgi:hypothetical protein